MAIVKGDYYQLIGTKLDRYLIQSVAGIGGMGTVYRAQHEITKGYVAIKVLRPENLPDDQNSIPMFFEEAVKTVLLNHPLIVKVIGADYTDRGLAYMVMEWLDGHTLAEEMTKQETLPCERVAELLDQICDAVAYAHDNNIIHRDLKPGNIMLVPDRRGDETIRVLDFGIAKAMVNTVGTNTRIAGSSYYISPEQTIARGRIDRCADIYSLGVMLYQMLTGKVPFDADTDGEIIDMHRTIDPVRLCLVNSEIPAGVEEVVMKALAKSPGDRYQNATDLARAFRQAAQMASGVIVLQCADQDDGSPVATATIYLNSRHAGQTDHNGCWQQSGLTPRKYLVEVEAPRYKRWHISESLGAREEVTIPVMLIRQPKGELIIHCGVANAEVELDGAKIGKTDHTGRLYLDSVDAGTHTIKLTHPKYLPAESNVEIAIWQQAMCELTMTERPRFQFKQLWQKATGASGKLRTTSDTASVVVKSDSQETTWPVAADPFKTSVPDETSPEPGPATTLQTCEKCGSRVPIGLKFCIECGAPFARRREEMGETRPIEPAPITVNELPDVSPEEVANESAEPIQETSQRFETIPFESTALPYVTLPSIPTSRPQNKKLWIGIAIAAVALSAVLLWIFKSSNPTVPAPVSFDLMLKVLPPGSQITVDGRTAQTTDTGGNLKLSGLIAGQTITIQKPCYESAKPSAQPSPNSPVEITLKKLPPQEGMVCIPGGKLTLGHNSPACFNEFENPAEVMVAPFWMDATEVTHEQYAKFLAEDDSRSKPLGWGDGNLSTDELQLPVTGIRWSEALAYARRYGKRLPTEAEWEFAARGGNQDRLYPWGNDFNQDKANAGKRLKLIPVGKFAPNDFGIFDLSGNVWEWTEDNFEGNPYRPNSSCPNCKILRGGSFREDSQYATTFCRFPFRPESGSNYSGVGFRCVNGLDK